MCQRLFERNRTGYAKAGLFAAGCFAVLLSAGCAGGYEHDHDTAKHDMAPGNGMVGPMVIDSAWARASIVENRPSAAYLTVTNRGKKTDRIVAVESTAAGKAEIHETQHRGGVMRMRPVETVEIRPGTSVVLAPGGLHIMLMKLDHMLKEGETIPMTVHFEHAGSAKVMVPIKKGAAHRGAAKHGDKKHHH